VPGPLFLDADLHGRVADDAVNVLQWPQNPADDLVNLDGMELFPPFKAAISGEYFVE
jgi:hypothetical protein